MVDNADNQQTRLITVNPNGQVFDLRGRPIAPADAGFNGEFGDRSDLGMLPYIATTAAQMSGGQLCLTNSTMLWHKPEGGD